MIQPFRIIYQQYSQSYDHSGCACSCCLFLAYRFFYNWLAMASNRIPSFKRILFWKSILSKLSGYSSVSLIGFLRLAAFLFSILRMICIKFSINSRFLFSLELNFFIYRWISLIFSGWLMYSLHFFNIRLKQENKQCPITKPILQVNARIMNVQPYSISIRVRFYLQRKFTYIMLGYEVQLVFSMIIDIIVSSRRVSSCRFLLLLEVCSLRPIIWLLSSTGREVVRRMVSLPDWIWQCPGVKYSYNFIEGSGAYVSANIEQFRVLRSGSVQFWVSVLIRIMLVEGKEQTLDSASPSNYFCSYTYIIIWNPLSPVVLSDSKNLKATNESGSVVFGHRTSSYQLVRMMDPSIAVAILQETTEELGRVN